MMRWLARQVTLHPFRVIAGWLILVSLSFALAFGAFGPSILDRLVSEQPKVPGSESSLATQKIQDASSTPKATNLVVTGLNMKDRAVVATLMRDMPAIRSELTKLPGVGKVLDPFVFQAGPAAPQAAPFLSTDGDGFSLRVEHADTITESERDALHQALRQVEGKLPPGAKTLISDTELIKAAIVGQVEEDLIRGEAIALPFSFLVMILVFGGFIAAGMPLIGAIASIGTGLAVIWIASWQLDIDSYIVNVLTIMGVALSVDYGLLVVSRFREELTKRSAVHRKRGGRRRDPAVLEAMETTLATAGRTVLFSALTVALSVAGLIVMTAPILRAVAIAGVAVVMLSVISAVTLVPAHLALLGRRVIKPSFLSRIPGLRRLVRAMGDVSKDEGVFSKLARGVHRVPWLVMVGVFGLLILLAYPLLHLSLRSNPMDYIPRASDQMAYVRTVDQKFPALQFPDMIIVTEATKAQASAWAATFEKEPVVKRVNPVVELRDGLQLITLKMNQDPLTKQAMALVDQVRGNDPGFPKWVGGTGAQMQDFNKSILDGLPAALTLVIGAVFTLMFLMTGSILLPIKALLVNGLSLAASIGVTVFIFQEGHLEGLLDFKSLGGIELVVLAFAIAFGFGLAMDYEVFLISRVKEYWDKTGNNDYAVEHGLQKSGRIITSAALIMMLVFVGLIAGKLIVIKQLGMALATTVLVDATLVRMLLVPATMTVLGKWNWWAPRPLARLHTRFGISEEERPTVK